jgi:hypothetical protein
MFNLADRQAGRAWLGPGFCFVPCGIGLRFDNGAPHGRFAHMIACHVASAAGMVAGAAGTANPTLVGVHL